MILLFSLRRRLFIIIILFLIRFVTGRTVSSIKDVSDAAKHVAKGDYEVSLPVKPEVSPLEMILGRYWSGVQRIMR